MKTLRELLDDAIHQVSTYKHPNIEEFQERISKVLVAHGQGSIEYDKIEDITERDGKVKIETSWMARQCDQRSTYELPAAVIDAEDHIKAANVLRLQEKIEEKHRALRNHEQAIVEYRVSIVKLEEELRNVTS
jgi:hypothetical protein